MIKLTIELVPSTCWYSNVRSNIPKQEWDRIRAIVYKKANNKCELCGGKGIKWPVEAHEIWHYDDANKIQCLIGLQALCPDCHLVKHIGRASITGNYNKALKHLIEVNQWSQAKANDYLVEQYKVWHERSKFDWTLDITILENIK